MSTHISQNRLTVPKVKSVKGAGSIVALTAYSTPMARLVDTVADITIVGDSVGMVVYGMDSTLEVSLQMMINHGKAVVRGTTSSLVVIDMPWGSYQMSPQQAYKNATKVLAETGAQAIKIEGGAEMADTICFLSERGIPVMAHIGLTPQYCNQLGGFKVQGKTAEQAKTLISTAKLLADAGAFSLLLEGVMKDVADEIVNHTPVPCIGIGASDKCDGQVLVTEDILGLFDDYTPRFVEQYAQLNQQIQVALEAFSQAVKSGRFPTKKHCF